MHQQLKLFLKYMLSTGEERERFAQSRESLCFVSQPAGRTCFSLALAQLNDTIMILDLKFYFIRQQLGSMK